MTTPSVFSRLYQMFSASQHDCDDPLRELLFRHAASFVESKQYLHTDRSSIENGIAVKDFLSDAYTYIMRDRPLKVDRCITQELEGNNVWTAILESDDSRYMQGIIHFRRFLF